MTSLTQSFPAAGFVEGSLARRVLAVLAGSAFLAVMSQITVPMYPVPMTMQTFAVLLIGAVCGWRLGAEILLAYIFEAEVGLPVLAQGKTGLATLTGPRGGYILGFLLAAIVVGYCAERGWHRTLMGLAASLAVGAVLVYVPGLPWLAAFIGLDKAITFGLLPFIFGDAVKAALAGAVVLAANQAMLRA